MPARSLKAQPDAELKSEIRELKTRVSDLDNANGLLKKQLGAAQKDQKALADLRAAHEAQTDQLRAAQAEISRLNADLNSAQAKGSTNSEIVAAARQVAEGLKKLGA